MSLQKVPGRDIASETVDGANIKDGSITNLEISNNAAIDTAKVDWTTLTQQEAVQQVTKQPEGIYFQNYDLEGATTYVTMPSTSTGTIQHFYLAYPLTVNSLTYIITSGSSSYRTRVAIWDCNYNLVWDSGNQSAASGIYKLTVPSILLLPGFYYISFMSNYTGARFLSQTASSYSVIPQRGTLYFGYYGNIPSQLDPYDITQSSSKQPWFVISKY